MKFLVAIDGPAAAGKGTISKAVASHFGFAHLDTGLLYRAIGAKVIAGKDAVEAAISLCETDLENANLRTPAVAQAASQVASNPDVRAALLEFQKNFASREGGAVLDGRDIGTVICPDADVKLFVTATPEVRAERRFLELAAKGMDVTREQVLSDVNMRDLRDMSRTSAPLEQAETAKIVDTSHMDIDEAVMCSIEYVQVALAKRV